MSEPQRCGGRLRLGAGPHGVCGEGAQHLFLGVLCLCLALCLTLANWQVVTNQNVVGHQDRAEMHREVLANRADLPYQYHMYLIAHATQWLHDALGVPLRGAFIAMFGLVYLFALVSSWYWLAQLWKGPAPIVLGLLAVAAYGGVMLGCSDHHPSDPFGAGLLALTLAWAAQGNWGRGVGAALIAGFFWTKGVLVGPAIALYGGLSGSWRRGWGWALAVTAAAAVGPAIYRLALGPHPLVEEGTLASREWIAALPKAAVLHLGLAGPVLCTLALNWGKIPAVLRAAMAIYPAQVCAYAVAGQFLYEPRSFWALVPVFAAVLGVWGEGVCPGAGSSGPLRE